MALQTDVTVKIGGVKINTFIDFELNQRIDSHHELTIECREEEVYQQNPGLKGNYHQLIGETILVTMQGVDRMFSTHTGHFKGIVTRVKAVNLNDSSGKRLQFRAYSPTILMDNGPESSSFLKKTFSDIVHDSTREYDKQLLKVVTQPLKDNPYSYIAQYNESDYSFLRRMCSRQGEWFYYNGTELIIGQENTGEEITLHYGYNLMQYDFEMSLQPTKFKYHGNDLSEGESHQSQTSAYEGRVDGITAELIKSSGRVFSKETTVQHNQLISEGEGKTDMESYAELNLYKKAANMVFVNGSSENPAVRPGAVIRILDEDGNSQGNFKVIATNHNCMGMGDYNNSFQAVPVSVQVSPFSNPGEYPKCESQSAMIMENNDPKGLGRVKVQMSWQKEKGQTTDWIPLSIPNGGSGKGFHFVPEIGESVMVDFQSGNAEVPFVTGSFQNNQAKSGFHDSSNNLKAIQSRSGSQVVMNDGDGSVTIADPSGNTVVMHGDGKITISAPEKIDFTSKEINLMASKKVNIVAEDEVNMGGQNTVNIGSKETNVEGTTSITMVSDSLIEGGAPKVDIQGETSVDISSATVNVNGEGMTNVKGGVLNLNT